MTTPADTLASGAGSKELERVEFAARVEETQRGVFQVAYSILHNAAEAEEIVQEAYLRAYRRFSSLRDPLRFRPWINRIALRLALNRRRSTRRRGTREAAWASMRHGSEGIGCRGPSDRILLERILEEIQHMPEKLRVVLLLSAVEGMDARAVGSILRIPVGTVRSRLFHARRRLLEGVVK